MIGDSTGPSNNGNILIVALAHGLAITLFIIALGRVSGGHINPAVTVAAVVTQRMGLTKGLMYVVAQLSGAALGAFTLAAFLEGSGIELSAHNLASGLEPVKGIIVEAVLTFFLVFTVIAVAMDPRGAGNSVSDCSDAKSKIPTRINMPEKTNDSFVGPEIDERSDGPRIVSSIIPMISKLNILLPKTVPMARSGASVSVTALMPVKISGREVAVASITAPRNPLLKPV